ncbi:hypothetical protein [Streptomyces sp. NPDC007904]|jgi:hypothetical protein|uniref:hypothetical protein n=1 Tax=Streptomyces sp. NPDC007904 TaxID=3364787 RepID=UPI0036E46C1A
MPALPARRLALGACCAALLVGITGPTAMAADPAREHTRVASVDALLAQARSLDTDAGELTPVVDLLQAVLGAGNRHLPPSEARRLGEAAKEALKEEGAEAAEAKDGPQEEVAKTPATTATPEASAPAVADTLPADTEDTLPADTEGTLTSDLVDAVREAVDRLVTLLLSDDEEDAAEVPSSVDHLLTEVDKLVDALVGAEPQVSILPAPADVAPSAQVPLLPPLTLPALTPLTPVLLPSS